MPSVASNVDLNADQDVHSPKPKLDHPINLRSVLAFLAIIALGLGYTAWSIYTRHQGNWRIRGDAAAFRYARRSAVRRARLRICERLP